jgi:hypothetical protein
MTPESNVVVIGRSTRRHERPVDDARPDLGDERCLVARLCVGSNAGPPPACSRLIAIWGEMQRDWPSG